MQSTHPAFATLLDEIVALDALTLADHTIAATGEFDLAVHRASLAARLAGETELIAIRREAQLVAYALYGQLPDAAPGDFFVFMLNTHPAHRNAATFRQLWQASFPAFERLGVHQLVSHVYRTNRLSIAMHERLGFSRRKENDRGIEFVATLAELQWPGHRPIAA
ncbi:MAG: GNAT family N-acetyltransferase [Burkholderiales bacterium]|nr:GNAT family N-acetyltransferase [Burkholderiales bacterium]